MKPTRRGFIGGLLAAPAVVQFANLMPLSATYSEIMFVNGSPLDMNWITAELCRQIHNNLLGAPLSHSGLAKLGEGFAKYQHAFDMNLPNENLQMSGPEFSERVIAPMASGLSKKIRLLGSRRTFALEVPKDIRAGVVARARGIVARGLQGYDITTDSMLTRFDILHG